MNRKFEKIKQELIALLESKGFKEPPEYRLDKLLLELWDTYIKQKVNELNKFESRDIWSLIKKANQILDLDEVDELIVTHFNFFNELDRLEEAFKSMRYKLYRNTIRKKEDIEKLLPGSKEFCIHIYKPFKNLKITNIDRYNFYDFESHIKFIFNKTIGDDLNFSNFNWSANNWQTISKNTDMKSYSNGNLEFKSKLDLRPIYEEFKKRKNPNNEVFY